MEHRSPLNPEFVDRRSLRPLRARNFVAELAGGIVATQAGCAYVSGQVGGESSASPTPLGALSPRQEEALRYLVRQTGKVPGDHVDGRVLRALRDRGLVVESGGWVSPTARAVEQFNAHIRCAS